MRLPVPALFALLAAGSVVLGLAGCASADSTNRTDPIVRVWTEYREAATFARFGELRDPDPEPGDPVILRSQPGERTGFYFIIRLQPVAGATAVPDGRLVLSVVAPNAAKPQSYEFPFASGGRRNLQLLVGLTGTDWPHGKTMPLAWKIELVDPAGHAIAERLSYLWAQP